MKRMILSLALSSAAVLTVGAEEMAAEKVRKTTHPKLGITVVSGQFKMDGSSWDIAQGKGNGVKWPGLVHETVPESVRYRRLKQLREVRQARHVMWDLVWRVRRVADANNGVVPATVDELPRTTKARFYESPWKGASNERMAADAQESVESFADRMEDVKARNERQIAEAERRLAQTKARLAKTSAAVANMNANTKADERKRLLEMEKRMKAEVAACERMCAMVRKEGEARLAAEAAAEAHARKRAAEAKMKLEAERRKGKTEKKVAYFYLIPNVKTDGPATPMILELRPYADDGMHYVGYSNREVRRVKVDKELLKKHGLVLHPLNPPIKNGADAVKYALYAQVVDPKATSVRVDLVDRKKPTRTMTITLDLAKAEPTEDKEDLAMWAELRAMEWARHAAIQPDSPCFYWLSRVDELYDGGDDILEQVMENGGVPRRRGRNASVFNVFGGRAAIQETLQTQVLEVNRNGSNEQTVAIADIEGVAVKSHDYKEMLAGKPGASLKIAELVPHDRLMVYFRRPADLADFLDTGDGFLYQSGSTVAATSFDHGLKERYSERLGVGTGWSKIFLKSKLVKEIIAFAPDIFFTDGTDLTVIMDVENMDLLSPMLATIGVKNLGNGNVVVKVNEKGMKSYWFANDTYLVISSNLKEMGQVRRLMNGKGAGSLGKSEEFRYMLTKLPMSTSTWGFAYMSDPFIRRLVGPEVKIGQFRRVKAQAEMEALSAAAMLYRVDGHKEKPTIKRLVELGYASPNLAARDYVLNDDLSVTSATFGQPSRLNSIQSLNVRRATESESKAYAGYMRNYNRFWRQFFDPIAIRLDEKPKGELEMEIFILPLIDSSIYGAVREFIGRPGMGPRMKVPQLDPPPVAMVSAKLQEKVWIEALENFGTEAFEQFGIQNFPFDELGPSVHLAMMDGDPVIALGSGDVLGAFNGNSRLFGRNSEMFMIPVVLSVLTRPCKLLIELRDAEKVTESLRAALAANIRIEDELVVSFAQIKGKDAWMVTLDIFGMIKLRFGLQVQNNYLVISNLPWNRADVAKFPVKATLDSAAIQIRPAAGLQQLPGLFAAANVGRRKAALRSAARLWPMMAAGATDLKQAREWHQAVFGFTPEHPGKGTFNWENDKVSSETYGSWDHQLEPEFVKSETGFGLFGKIKFLNLSMQLEDDGLRTRFRWKLNSEKAEK